MTDCRLPTADSRSTFAVSRSPIRSTISAPPIKILINDHSLHTKRLLGLQQLQAVAGRYYQCSIEWQRHPGIDAYRRGQIGLLSGAGYDEGRIVPGG